MDVRSQSPNATSRVLHGRNRVLELPSPLKVPSSESQSTPKPRKSSLEPLKPKRKLHRKAMSINS